MTSTKPNQQGKKTKEQQRRTLEREPDLPRDDADGDIVADGDDGGRAIPHAWTAPGGKASSRSAKAA